MSKVYAFLLSVPALIAGFVNATALRQAVMASVGYASVGALAVGVLRAVSADAGAIFPNPIVAGLASFVIAQLIAAIPAPASSPATGGIVAEALAEAPPRLSLAQSDAKALAFLTIDDLVTLYGLGVVSSEEVHAALKGRSVSPGDVSTLKRAFLVSQVEAREGLGLFPAWPGDHFAPVDLGQPPIFPGA